MGGTFVTAVSDRELKGAGLALEMEVFEKRWLPGVGVLGWQLECALPFPVTPKGGLGQMGAGRENCPRPLFSAAGGVSLFLIF